MKKIYLALAFACFLSNKAGACDICSCFMGITPYDNQSGVALMHRYRVFNGYQEFGQDHSFFPKGVQPFVPSRPNQDTGYQHQHIGDATDYEAYRVVELRGKYFLSKRLEINAFVPYVMNTSQGNGQQLNTAGLGDVTIFAGFHLLRAIETSGVQSRLIVGGGAKLPTGEHRRTNPAGRRYSLLNQPGTGTTDGFVYANYIGSFRSVGLSVNSSYRRSTRNSFGNNVAPSTASFANLFYRVALGPRWQVYPSAQFYYEKTKGEMLDGQLTHEHAMNDALLGPGLDIYYDHLSLNTSAQFPVFTAPTAHPASAGRMVVALGYSFRQTKYLLKARQPAS